MIRLTTPDPMVVEMLGIESLPMTKWLIDPRQPKDDFWKSTPDEPGNGIVLNPHAVVPD